MPDFFEPSKQIAQIIAADAISLDFKPSQSFGKTLAAIPEVLLKSSPFDGFSNYSAEKCHEFVHGIGTCPSYLARDSSCTGNKQLYMTLRVISQCHFPPKTVTKEWMSDFGQAMRVLAFDELGSRLEQRSNRLFGGRADEAVYHHVTGIVPTHYTFMASADSLLWRYVSKIAQRMVTCQNIYLLMQGNIDEVYSNIAMISTISDYYTETISYAEYFISKLTYNYITKVERGIPHDWRLGTFVNTVHEKLESQWLETLLDGVGDDLLSSPLQACRVCNLV